MFTFWFFPLLTALAAIFFDTFQCTQEGKFLDQLFTVVFFPSHSVCKLFTIVTRICQKYIHIYNIFSHSLKFNRNLIFQQNRLVYLLDLHTETLILLIHPDTLSCLSAQVKFNFDKNWVVACHWSAVYSTEP